jgi:hypothetical protein
MMVMGSRPDPMCIFTYVQSLYNHLKKFEWHPCAEAITPITRHTDTLSASQSTTPYLFNSR